MMKPLTLASLFLLCTVSMAVPAASFVETQVLPLDINGHISGLQASGNGQYAVVYGDATKYWLVTGITDKPMALTLLTSNRPGYRSPVEPIINPLVLRGKQVIDDSISQAQWANERLVLFADNNTYFIDPVRKVISHSYPLLKTGHDSKKHWSETHQRLIHGSELIDKHGKTAQQEEDRSQAFHGHQTGLLVAPDESQYITAGFHTQDIKIWSLPDGRLLKKFELGGLFSRRKVTGIALLQNRLLVASESGAIEARSRDTAEVGWSIRPCTESAEFVTSAASSDRVYFRCGAVFGAIRFDNGRWTSAQQTQDSLKPESVTEVPARNVVVVGFSNGKVLSYNMDTWKVQQEIQTGQSGAANVPAHVAYLNDLQKLLVVEQPNRLRVFKWQH